ncbi:MAG: hypothetical protein ACLR43_03020 [Faecalibacillus faecis]
MEGMKEDHDENEDESEYDEHVWLSLLMHMKWFAIYQMKYKIR